MDQSIVLPTTRKRFCCEVWLALRHALAISPGSMLCSVATQLHPVHEQAAKGTFNISEHMLLNSPIYIQVYS